MLLPQKEPRSSSVARLATERRSVSAGAARPPTGSINTVDVPFPGHLTYDQRLKTSCDGRQSNESQKRPRLWRGREPRRRAKSPLTRSPDLGPELDMKKSGPTVVGPL